MEKIALVDIDDTSVPVDEIVQQEHQAELKNYPPEATAKGILNSPYPEIRALRQKLIVNPDWIRSLVPYKGTFESYQYLVENGYQIVVASARTELVRQATIDCFNKFGLAQFVKRYIFRSTPRLDVQDFKLGINQHLQPEVTFEDNGLVGQRLAEGKKLVYIIQKPWNQGVVEGDHLRLCSSLYHGVTDFLSRLTPSPYNQIP